MSKPVHVTLDYFGKIPSRGDFVRSGRNPPLLRTLDQWLSRSMELLNEDPRWRLVYDHIAPIHFAFIGSHSKVAVAGHLIASADASARRFPFIAAAAFDVEPSSGLIARSPLTLARLWSQTAIQMQPLLAAAEPSGALQALSDLQIAVDIGAHGHAHDGTFADFIEHQTLGGLEQLLQRPHAAIRPHRTILALGMLLTPLRTAAATRAEKSLTLPLPVDPFYRSLVASFWLELISRFVSHADFELAIFMTTIDAHPRLIVGLDGGSPRTLHGIIDPATYIAQNIDIDDPEWVDAPARADIRISKLVSYLDQPQLSLRVAIDTFREVFIGE